MGNNKKSGQNTQARADFVFHFHAGTLRECHDATLAKAFDFDSPMDDFTNLFNEDITTPIDAMYQSVHMHARAAAKASGESPKKEFPKVLRRYVAEGPCPNTHVTLVLAYFAGFNGYFFNTFDELLRVLAHISIRINKRMRKKVLKKVKHKADPDHWHQFLEQYRRLFNWFGIATIPNVALRRDGTIPAETFCMAVELFVGLDATKVHPHKLLLLAHHGCQENIDSRMLLSFLTEHGLERLDDVIALFHEGLLDQNVFRELADQPELVKALSFHEIKWLIEEWVITGDTGGLLQFARANKEELVAASN